MRDSEAHQSYHNGPERKGGHSLTQTLNPRKRTLSAAVDGEKDGRCLWKQEEEEKKVSWREGKTGRRVVGSVGGEGRGGEDRGETAC